MDELIKIAEYLRDENKRIEKDRCKIFGYDRLIEQNENLILFIEKRIEEIEDELYREDRRREVEEMRR